jgi:hypothetical protein
MTGTVRRSMGVLAAATIGALVLVAPGASAAASPSITASADRSAITFGDSITISGQASDGTAPYSGPVELQAKPFGEAVWTAEGTTTPSATGSYSFPGVKPDRNARYRVVYPPSPTLAIATSPDVPVTVDEKLTSDLTYLPLGEVRVKISSQHPKDIAWGGRDVYWFVAEGTSDRFRLVDKTQTKQGTGGITKLSARFPVDAGKFRFMACFSAKERQAFGVPSSHRRCHHRDFTGPSKTPHPKAASDFWGSGSSPYGFPLPSHVRSARNYLLGRRGVNAFAVIDSQGRLDGLHLHTTFVSASVVKAMLLVAYLRKLDAHHQGLTSSRKSILYPMIHVSDNSAATSIWRRVGDGRLYDLAHHAGMTDFSIVGIWANAQISASDQARFFFNMDGLIPHQFVGYARYLLSTIVSYQRWGIPHVADSHWHVFFKGGWRGTGRGQLVHQIGRLERSKTTFAMAVLTDGDPSMGYGIDTIQGVTARLLGGHLPPRTKLRALGPGG